MKILIAQDDPASRKSLEAQLTRWGHEVVSVRDGEAAWQALQHDVAPNVAILDVLLPRMDALHICQEMRKRTDVGYVYFLLMVEKGRGKDMLEGLRVGADDFLAKPVIPDELMVRLRVARRILELQEELNRAQEAVGYQTTHDPLTGAWNRAAILDTIRRELARVQREGSSVALILAEVDDFKRINETYGHLAGDAVLRETARCIRSVIRPYDTLGRYGSEEFLILVPGCDQQKAVSQAERLRSGLSGKAIDVSEWGKFPPSEKGTVIVTLSVAVAAGSKIKDPEAILRAVESALDRAKKQGPNHIELAQQTEFA